MSEFIQEANNMAGYFIENKGMPEPGMILFAVSWPDENALFFSTAEASTADTLLEYSADVRAKYGIKDQFTYSEELLKVGLRDKSDRKLEVGLGLMLCATLEDPGSRKAYEDSVRNGSVPFFAAVIDGGETHFGMAELVREGVTLQ